MISLHRHDDVLRVHMRSWRSAAAGYSVNAFLVRGWLVDTGFPDARRELARLIAELRPAGVLVTHQHEDHAGNLTLIAERDLPVHIADVTVDALRTGERSVGLYRRVCWGTMHPLRASLRRVDADGLALIHTPGHSPDHHIVWDAERETMFAGDLFLGVRVRVARPMEDPRALARSLRAAAALGPARLFDAHRGEVPDPAGALLAKADWLDETIASVDALAARGWSDRAITRQVLGREDPTYYASLGDLSRLNFVRAARYSAALDSVSIA